MREEIKVNDEVAVVDGGQIVKAVVLEIKKNWLRQEKYRCMFQIQHYLHDGTPTWLENSVKWFTHKNIYKIKKITWNT